MLKTEKLNEKLKKFYDKTKDWLRRTNLKGAVLLALLPTGAAASSKADAPTDNHLSDRIEKILQPNDSAFAEAGRTYEFGDSLLNVDKAVEAVSQMTIGELLKKRLIDPDFFLDYKFTPEDFQKMEPGSLGERLESQFKKICDNKKPQGHCLRSVRKTVYDVTGINIPSQSPYYAKDWWRRVDEREDAPFVLIGTVEQVQENGKIKDVGNIKKLDLLALQDVVVVVDGKEQPAGHVTFFGSGDSTYCDGIESKRSVLRNMNNGRYENKAWVLMPKDTKISSKPVAEHLVKKIMSTHLNVIDLSEMLASAEISAEELLNQSTQNTLVAKRLNDVREVLAQWQKKSQEPEIVLAKVEPKHGQQQLASTYWRTHNHQIR